MAVTTTGYNPLVLTGTTAASTLILEKTNALVHVQRVTWLRPTTAGHKLSLKDRGGEVIAALVADGDGLNQYQDVNVSYDGIYCDDMDSGTAYIYIR